MSLFVAEIITILVFPSLSGRREFLNLKFDFDFDVELGQKDLKLGVGGFRLW